MSTRLLLLAAVASFAARGEWVAWPAGAGAPPAGLPQRVDAATGVSYVDVANATEAVWRASVDAATRAEDPTEPQSRREAMASALGRLPRAETDERDPAEMTLEELEELWAARQAALREFSERLSDGARTLQGHIAALVDPGDDGRLLATLDALDFDLSELDAAKDFHDALGGWPALAARLRGGAAETRAAALRCVGTAVKNGFQPWALERGVLGAAVEALADADPTFAVPKAALYAVGASLRGSAACQRAFGASGAQALAAAAARALGAFERGAPQAWAVADKAAALAGDLAAEGRALPHAACDAVAAVLRAAPRDRKVDRPLRAALAAAPACGARWRADDALGPLNELADLDADYAAELRAVDADLRAAVRRAEVQPSPTAPDLEILPKDFVTRIAAAAARPEL